jgi:phosphomannomutase
MLDTVCERAGVALHRTPVGEAHVVEAMRAHHAAAGGEGNGGMILPAAHHGRDALVAMVLVAQAMRHGATLRELADALPCYAMIKDKLARPEEPWERAAARLEQTFAGWTLDRRVSRRGKHEGGGRSGAPRIGRGGREVGICAALSVTSDTGTACRS